MLVAKTHRRCIPVDVRRCLPAAMLTRGDDREKLLANASNRGGQVNRNLFQPLPGYGILNLQLILLPGFNQLNKDPMLKRKDGVGQQQADVSNH
jgi:hypothetical protein